MVWHRYPITQRASQFGFGASAIQRHISGHTLNDATQTYSQLLADIGQIPQHEVSTHHLRHILTDAIGVGAGKVNVKVRHLPLLNEDRLLLCTDGLTEMVDEEEIAGVLMRDQSAQDTCQTLVDLALEHGGTDNVTVLLAKYEIPV